ncbi:MAG: TetR/AcrR family transcriptional regulator [Bacillus sp. (in: firmicutes)]
MSRDKKFSTADLFDTTHSLLMKYGYEGFSFSILAEAMQVSRAAIYKYYKNKDDLIIDFMLHEMNKMMAEIKEMDTTVDFFGQLDQLLTLIFRYKDIHQILEMFHYICKSNSTGMMEKKEHLERLHLDMYRRLNGFIDTGKGEGLLREHIPNDVILGYIFQSIAIPNHQGRDNDEWVTFVKDIILHGIYRSVNK